MMEAASASETLVNFYQTKLCKKPEDSHLHILIRCLFLSPVTSTSEHREGSIKTCPEACTAVLYGPGTLSL
jgi:hypothetical protein